MLFVGKSGIERGEGIGRGAFERLAQFRVGVRAKQTHESLERHQFSQRGHVDSVAVRVADGWRGGRHDDALRAESVEHRQNCVFHRVAAHDGVVQDDKRVLSRPQQAVRDVVDVLVELIPRMRVGDEGAEFRVLDGDLPEARNDILALDSVSRTVRTLRGRSLPPKQFLQQSVEGDLRGVRNVGEKHIGEVGIGSLQDLRQKRGAEGLAFAVDGGVVGAREVDSFKGAWTRRGRGEDALEGDITGGRNQQRHARRQLPDGLRRHIERRLDRGPLACDGHRARAFEEPPRPNPAGVAHGERPAVARHAAEREGAVESWKDRAKGAEDGWRLAGI